MPFYDYKCDVCGLIFEEFQSITDEDLPKCPECSGTGKKLISNTSSQIVLGSKELGEKLKQEAKKDAQDIRDGDWEKASDYLGEQGALDFYGKK
jgi:putative FmdB family regulatory protein